RQRLLHASYITPYHPFTVNSYQGNSFPSKLINFPVHCKFISNNSLLRLDTLSSGVSKARSPPIAVFTQPGCRATTTMPLSLRFQANVLTIAFTAALLARYAYIPPERIS